MDIPSFRSQSEIANPKARIEDSTKDNTNIQPQPKTLDSTYISMSAGLFFIFVQVRFSVYNTPNLIQNYFKFLKSFNQLATFIILLLDLLFGICWRLQRIHYQTYCGR